MRKTPVTLGVLAIVFGSAVALLDGVRLLIASAAGAINKSFGAAMVNAPRQPGAPDPSVMIAKSEAIQRQLMPYTMSLMAAMVIFSVALIIIGVGLYKRRTWARSGALGWSVLGLLYLAADLLVHFSVILPRTQQLMREMFESMPNADKMGGMAQAMSGAQSGFVVIAAVVLAVFPVLLLALLGRRSAAADFVD
jgi:hypothetical protein